LNFLAFMPEFYGDYDVIFAIVMRHFRQTCGDAPDHTMSMVKIDMLKAKIAAAA